MPAPKKRKGEEGSSEVSTAGTPAVKKRRKGIQYDPVGIFYIISYYRIVCLSHRFKRVSIAVIMIPNGLVISICP